MFVLHIYGYGDYQFVYAKKSHTQVFLVVFKGREVKKEKQKKGCHFVLYLVMFKDAFFSLLPFCGRGEVSVCMSDDSK